jgi:hypothetical protein
VRQPTHVAVEGLQTGVAPVHWLPLLAEQLPQAPLVWQAGVAPPHSPSPAQPRQVCVPASHAGAVPPHWAAVTHPTHVPLSG